MDRPAWNSCDSPIDMLRHLDGRIDDAEFMRFSVACCRRIWELITDRRSRTVIEATEAYLASAMSAKEAGRICAEWARAYEAGKIQDLAGGGTNSAIESVNGLGYGHAAQVAIACSESAGYAASESVRTSGGNDVEFATVWKEAERAERSAQCDLLRELFKHQIAESDVNG